MSPSKRTPAKSAPNTAVVAGVGASKGLGAALARRLAKEGLRVVLAGRTRERLEAVAEEIAAQGGSTVPVVTDLTREKDVVRLFAGIGENARLELAIYNAGANRVASLLDVKKSEFEALWKQNALGGFLFGREAVRRMLGAGRGTLIFTGATASLRARPPYAAFASAKAALRAAAQGFAREFGPSGIHVAHVIIDGVIEGDYARATFADYAHSKGEGGLLQPDAIADAYWAIHRQTKSAWTFELDLRPYKEPF